ncbi:M24 family metallopeptidase [Paracraurococcus lichenis]|uniref:Xaa-Pro peptidase family protein n=1 Tax=Paracraurococcus lichenis TaxID=3064888 RepID=A0ABT9DUM5_9PROT|nr:Xaa-Pro peptidase family protein [Paracraurococcus sp. LOR1-02]MDO9707603.1 Xaa-Pro peptidase family protein [Paracraurococcus sp. LOR1-02]
MPTGRPAIPFDTALLDRLMEQAGMEVLLATSKPAVQHLLGGYRFHFFEHADAIGQSRYMPVLAYIRGQPDRTGYIGHRMEKGQQAVQPLWVPEIRNLSGTSTDAMRQAVEYLRSLGIASPRIGIEQPFLPADALQVLRDAFPNSALPDAVPVLERLRAVKSEEEIGKLRLASDRVIESMLVVMRGHGPGTTKRELVEALRREEVSRGLGFDYCLITTGTSLNRAPSEERWEKGGILSLDSGGHYQGYIGDVCRMAILGEPDSELQDLLAEIDGIQQAAFGAVRAGTPGGAVYAAAEAALRSAPNRQHMDFLAHGMGLVSHEVPHLTATGPIPYAAEDAERPLQAGMVLSIETTLPHPQRGFIKLEDTVVVRPDGYEILGNAGRGWNRGGL